MSSRFPQRPQAPRGPVAPVHRGPQALPPGAAFGGTPYGYGAPNAALLIDFDNVTMGIQKDMQAELRNLLSSDIIKGKVSVQRAYADWRRYPSYVVPLTENSIDLIFAPAYGSAKKNATDIRLAIDAMELVFTRPEIGTFILLSGDSDFSSLVIKLKEYGKYVIGVGIRESASDLLVQNCDEYYSYNALAGLVNTRDEEQTQRRWDPYELVAESVQRMVRDDDVMRADRLKQVMQDIDPSFDEKDLGMAKFSRFVTEAQSRGLLAVTRLDSGQYEIAPGSKLAPARDAARDPRRDEPRREEARRDAGTVALEAGLDAEADEVDRTDRSRRRGRGRGRGRDAERDLARYPRTDEGAEPKIGLEDVLEAPVAPPAPLPPAIGTTGERLTRAEAFDLVRRAAEALTTDGVADADPAAVREQAFALLGRDSESLSDRMFDRILRDAADAGLVELRRDGDAVRVARSTQVTSVADQFNRAAAATQAPAVETLQPRGLGNRGLPRGRGGRGPGAPPPELLLLGAVAPLAGVGSASTEEAEPAAPFEVATSSAGEAIFAALGADVPEVEAQAPASAEAPPAAAAELEPAPEPPAPVEPPALVRGNLRGRGRGGRGGRGGTLPPELLLTGAVAPAVTVSAPALATVTVAAAVPPAAEPPGEPSAPTPVAVDPAEAMDTPAATSEVESPQAETPAAPEPAEQAGPAPEQAPSVPSGRGRGRGRGGRKSAAKQATAPQDATPQPPVPPVAPPPTAAPAAASKQPAAKQPRGRQPAAKQVAAKQPATKQAAAKQGAAKQATAKQPAAKQAASKQAGQADAGRPDRRRRPRPAAKRAE